MSEQTPRLNFSPQCFETTDWGQGIFVQSPGVHDTSGRYATHLFSMLAADALTLVICVGIGNLRDCLNFDVVMRLRLPREQLVMPEK
jgi:hypothetical protein